MKIAFTSDIHADVSTENEDIVHVHLPALCREAPDVFVICGDVSADRASFARVLRAYDKVTCPKLVVAGNHDLWVDNKQENSVDKYRYVLPRLAEENGFSYLGFSPYTVGRVGFVGTCGWYDYSFRNENLDDGISESDYRRKQFGTRRWMDVLHCDWSSMEDRDVTGMMNQSLKRQIADIGDRADHIVVVLHHVPFRALLTYKGEPSWDFLNAFTGSRSTEEIIRSCAKVRTVLFGHTHERKRCELAGITAATCSVGYKWEWDRKGLDPGESVGFVELETNCL